MTLSFGRGLWTFILPVNLRSIFLFLRLKNKFCRHPCSHTFKCLGLSAR